MTEANGENVEPTHKKVDENWKKQVEREKVRETAKETQQQQQRPRGVPPEPDSFTAFIAGLTMQAMMAMGEMADPKTGMQRENPAEAQYLIDTIAMLQEKTTGNLTEQEAAAIEEAVYSLRMAYVRKTSGPQGGRQGNQK
jgi:hypothetical protein